MLVERRFGVAPGGRRGVPRRRRAVGARDLRRRDRAAARAGARLQAHRRRRHRAQHRRDGLLLAGARGRRRVRRAHPRRGPPAGGRRARPPRHAVPRRPLRGPDAHRGRARRCSSTTSASAIPRRRPCSRGCARTCSTCCSARRGRAASAGAALEWDAAQRRHRRAGLARLSRSPRRRATSSTGWTASPTSEVEVTHAGTARDRRRDRHGRRAGPQRDRAGGRPRVPPGSMRMLPPT